MSDWKSIETISGPPIWVIKYDLFCKGGDFCGPDDGGEKFTECHGWYEHEADAMTVLRHFPKPNTYRIEKVNKRSIIPTMRIAP